MMIIYGVIGFLLVGGGIVDLLSASNAIAQITATLFMICGTLFLILGNLALIINKMKKSEEPNKVTKPNKKTNAKT